MPSTHTSVLPERDLTSLSTTLLLNAGMQVFDKIQGRLQRSVEARSPLSVERRLKEQYDQYLHTTNTKVAVFRDVIIEADYNPMTANDASIRIPTGKSNTTEASPR